jgi:exopolysaccharide biosynthesis polyprenyl glycosylphosphotransferase
VWAGISLTTVAVRAFYAQRRASGKGTRHVLIVGTDRSVLPLVDNLLVNHPELGVRITGYLGYEQGLDADIAYLGSPRDLPRILQTHIVDEVIVALRPGDLYELDTIVHAAREQGKTVRIPLPSMGYSIAAGELETLDGTPLLTVSSGPSRSIAFATKRLVDLAVSTVALVALAPVMGTIALVLLLKEGRPIVYADRRAGIHGRPITIHKFRTMVRDANEQRAGLAALNDRVGPDFKVVDDPRITPIGAFLRRTSLDELPQFWDVFVGSMSIVGPRAQRLDEVAGYDAWHRRRLSVKPGVTGLWQVTARQDPSFETRALLDMEYIDNWSPLLDARIMVQTIPAVLRSTGS